MQTLGNIYASERFNFIHTESESKKMYKSLLTLQQRIFSQRRQEINLFQHVLITV